MKAIIECMVLTASTRENTKEAGKFYSKVVIMQDSDVNEFSCDNELVESLKALFMKPKTKLVFNISEYQGKLILKAVGLSL